MHRRWYRLLDFMSRDPSSPRLPSAGFLQKRATLLPTESRRAVQTGGPTWSAPCLGAPSCARLYPAAAARVDAQLAQALLVEPGFSETVRYSHATLAPTSGLYRPVIGRACLRRLTIGRMYFTRERGDDA
jgi:hypothetical protein